MSGDKQTDYQAVKTFMKKVGQPVRNTPWNECFDGSADARHALDFRTHLVQEEFTELTDALQQKNMAETVDALVDILYVVHGFGVTLGVDLDKAFDIVQASNMSKLCSTEAEAKETVQWYRDNESDRYDSPAYRKSGDKFAVFNESSGKILKSTNYTPANFNSLLGR